MFFFAVPLFLDILSVVVDMRHLLPGPLFAIARFVTVVSLMKMNTVAHSSFISVSLHNQPNPVCAHIYTEEQYASFDYSKRIR